MRNLIVPLVLLLHGCFWASDPPDLSREDQAVKLTVIWDRAVVPDVFRREAWQTTDRAVLDAVVPLLKTSPWTSASVLPTCHPTRYIVHMRSGSIWEICQGLDRPERFRMFDRSNRGWSGGMPRPQAFLDALTRQIQAERDFPVDLNVTHTTELRTGAMRKEIPDTTWAVLNEYPGYPELGRDPKTGKLVYLDNDR